MDEEHFERISSIPCKAEELDAWHHTPGAFERLTPPWERVKIIEQQPIENGKRCTLKVKSGPFWRRWVAEYRAVEPGSEFTDVQITGPFSAWRHRHRFISKGKSKSRRECSLVDEISYKPPLGFLGKFVAGRMIRRKLERTFTYRHDVTRTDIERAASRPADRPMRILVSGATGLVGSALIPFLKMRGHTVLRLTRTPKDEGDIAWDPSAGQLDLSTAGRIDAAVHLAGENVASGRWNKKRKDRIFYSRKNGTRLIAEALAALPDRPRVMVSASGINYYEQDAVNTHDESSPIGTSFLSEVCRVWEEGTRPAEDAAIRVVKLRIGMVLTPAGGALKKMLPPFKVGLGGRVGSGRQRSGWIAIDDLVEIIDHALDDEKWSGAINAVAGEPPSNREFAKTLATVLRRPAFLPVPKFAVRLLFGKMVDETLLADLAVYSKRLDELGYDFRYPDLEGALRHVLGAQPPQASAGSVESAPVATAALPNPTSPPPAAIPPPKLLAKAPATAPEITLTPKADPPTVKLSEKSGGAEESAESRQKDDTL